MFQLFHFHHRYVLDGDDVSDVVCVYRIDGIVDDDVYDDVYDGVDSVGVLYGDVVTIKKIVAFCVSIVLGRKYDETFPLLFRELKEHFFERGRSLFNGLL